MTFYPEQLGHWGGPSTEHNLDTGTGPSVQNYFSGYDNSGYDNYTHVDNYATNYRYDHNQDVTSPPRELMRRDRYLHVPEHSAAPRGETRRRSCVGQVGYQSVHDPLLNYSLPEPRRQSAVDRNDTNIYIDGIDEIPTNEMKTGDDWDEDWNSNRLSEGDDEDIMPPPIEDRFSIKGRKDKQPVRKFNDYTSFEEVYISFFGTRVVYNEEISPGQLSTNIEELSSKVKQFHLKGNWEFKVARRERNRYAVIYKDARCKWKMSAVPQGRGDAWIIKKLE